MLTKRQYELLCFLIDYKKANYISPSYDEIKDALNLKTKSHVGSLLTNLEDRGFIARLRHKARAIEILKHPDGASPQLQVAEPESQPYVPPASKASIQKDYMDVPYYGTITSTISVDHFIQAKDTIIVPYFCVPAGGESDETEYMALKVGGDTMKENAILNGDLVILKTVETAEPGSIVLAVIEDRDVVLRRFSIEGEKVLLTAGNKYLMPQVYNKSQVKIHGKVVALFRKWDA